MKNQKLVSELASRFLKLDLERIDHERKANEIKKTLNELKDQLQSLIGCPKKAKINVAQIFDVGDYFISQQWNHRDGYETKPFDFLTFKVSNKK